MSSKRLDLLVACSWALITGACGSDPIAGPTLGELRGEWAMSWTESGTGVTCVWSDVTLSLRDSTKGPPGFWGGGQGSCVGLVEGDNLILVRFVVDSLVLETSHIRFAPAGSSYHFEGRAGTDEMSGTMSAAPYHVGTGTQLRTTGRWRAVRQPTP